MVVFGTKTNMNQATQVQHRYGSTAMHASLTGIQGEFTFNTDTKRLHVHDGLTVGGLPVAFASEVGNSRLWWSAGDPNGSKIGKVGDMCIRMDTKSLFIKTSGDNTNTGWE